jgi:hypothetical protein
MSGSAAAAATAKPQTLDELMLAMDVVDTIRHRELLVARELGQGARDDELRRRLREIYKSQGIEVTDRVLDEGIKALKESRFTYTPPAPGFSRSLALMWVRRGAIVGWTSALLIGIGALWGGYHYGIVVPRERAQEAARIELTETLPKQLAAAHAAVIAEARVQPARDRADALLRDGQTILARSKDLLLEGQSAPPADLSALARTTLASLDELHAKLVQTYKLRIVAQGTTGFYRISNEFEGTRNYYIVVEPIAPDGSTLTLPVTNEEDGRSYRVNAWGVRVPQATFDAVARDKTDNGIIENRIMGEKQRGELDPRYTMSVLGGAVTAWDDE